jgi:succinyl-diaminopimelate desuccinylase
MNGLLRVLTLASFLAGQTGSGVERVYHDKYAARLEPLVCEAVAFRTEAGNKAAIEQQARWLETQAKQFGLVHRAAGPVTEVELPGPSGSPVLGLLVHGDVQPPGDYGWTTPPFECGREDGYISGRGVADDKGPLVQALLAMATIRDDPRPRTHTVRLLVGSDEESDNQDISTYLKTHNAPDVTLVLDSEFPVVVGEKAWDALELTVASPYQSPGSSSEPWALAAVEAGVSPSIVPREAVARLRWVSSDRTAFPAALRALCPAPAVRDYQCESSGTPDESVLTITGRAAHSGMNIEGGRNALVFLANTLHGRLRRSPAAVLLEFAALAGRDLHGAGLGLDRRDPLWGQFNVNVATLKAADGGALKLTINLRRIPPMTGEQLKAHLSAVVAKFSEQEGVPIQAGGVFQDTPFVVDPDAKLVRRLLAAYERGTGEHHQAAIAGGGTYAKRLPNAVAFGMWFPGKPYPGHDVNERIAVADLHKGMTVLLEALSDLAYAEPLRDPLKP